jgi:DNA-binding Xre family transcriptional regulator
MAEKVDAFFVIAAAWNRDASGNETTTTPSTARVVEAAKVLGFTDAEIVQLLCRLDGALVSQVSPTDLPNNIRELREKRGFSITKLADHIGTSHATISGLELGQRQLTEEWMRKIARVLDCAPADLMSAQTPNAAKVPPRN